MLFSAWISTSRSPIRRALASARSPQSTVSVIAPASIDSCAMLLYAMASSCPSPSGSRVATARRRNAGVVAAAQQPRQARQPALRRANCGPLVKQLEQIQRPVARRESLLHLRDQIALIGQRLIKPRSLLAGSPGTRNASR